MLFASIAAVGAGLHVLALTFGHQAQLGPVSVIATVVIPLGLFVGVFLAMTLRLLPSGHPLHEWLALGSAAVLAAAVVLAAAGTPIALCRVAAVLAPVAWVVAYEIVGHRHVADGLAQLEASR